VTVAIISNATVDGCVLHHGSEPGYAFRNSAGLRSLDYLDWQAEILSQVFQRTVIPTVAIQGHCRPAVVANEQPESRLPARRPAPVDVHPDYARRRRASSRRQRPSFPPDCARAAYAGARVEGHSLPRHDPRCSGSLTP
jgi:hypothetical protein